MAISIKSIDLKGKASGEVAAKDAVFGAKPYQHLVFDTVIAQLASRRQGTAKTKTRAEVRGGGKKPYKQKGTGNARRGSQRSPLLPGGGRVFGPKPRSYDMKLNKKVVNQAICVALSNAQRAGKLYVLKDSKIEKPKTEVVADLFGQLKISKGIVIDSKNQPLERSVRNFKNAKYLEVEGINVYDLVKYENVIVSTEAVKKLEARLT